MKRIQTKDQWRQYAEQWRHAGPELERIHWEELRAYQYKPEDADALLELGDQFGGPARVTSGLVEMQRLFMKMARQQGLLPAEVHEEDAPYSAGNIENAPESGESR